MKSYDDVIRTQSKLRRITINYIGFIQSILRDEHNIGELSFYMGMSQKQLMPHLVKLVRRKRKYHEFIKTWLEYQWYCKEYRLDKIVGFDNMVIALKSAPSTMPEPKVKKKEGQLIKAIMEENHHVKTII